MFIDFPSMKYYTFSKAGIFAKPWAKTPPFGAIFVVIPTLFQRIVVS